MKKMMNYLRGWMLKTLLIVWCMTTSGIAGAQDTLSLEDITVTAQKQEQNIQDVPMAITAFTAQGIEDAKIESMSDLADLVPSLVINGGKIGMNTPTMRGIHAPYSTFMLSTGLFIDGVPVQSMFGYETTFLDIERVEVLKGPQGTLYGKNSEAGVINIITRQPDNNFRGSLSANIGTWLSSGTDDPLTQAYTIKLSTPIQTDKFFVGIAGKFLQQDGTIENTETGNDEDHREYWFGRAHLRWTPTDQLDISFIASQLQYDSGGGNDNLLESGASNYGVPTPGYRKVSSNLEPENTSSEQTQSLNIKYEINDVFELTSVTARRVFNDDATNDFDHTNATISHMDKDNQYTTLSQELRLSYDNGGVKWIAGVYGDTDEINFDYKYDYGSMINISDMDIDGNTYAVFTNLTYPLSQRFSLVGGLRYETTEKDFQDHIDARQANGSWDDISPKFALEYRPLPGTMTYISASKGYRAGGFNFMATDPRYYTFDEEELWSYEIGVKNTFFNNRLIANASIYLMDISDMQVTEMILSTNKSYVTNAAKATGKGVELELTGKIIAGLTMTAGFGYTHIEFDDFKDAAGDYEGNKTTYAPEYTFNLGAQYRWENGFYARADLIGYGEMYTDRANKYKRDAYQIVNAKIGYETEHYDIYLYGKNIFDERYDTYGSTSINYSDPGEVGLQVTYRF
ncbi:TonB-dependent receptor [uncultured Desulfobacter sp.]|uniref:TonB-dependent receptor n=1 Tax=uncultured Desulfobacter sp. TaxID=240139 RepID=UPI0029F5B028|nr:TonB-dependent receptor [uncultured Desulfobacter sp.]